MCTLDPIDIAAEADGKIGKPKVVEDVINLGAVKIPVLAWKLEGIETFVPDIEVRKVDIVVLANVVVVVIVVTKGRT